MDDSLNFGRVVTWLNDPANWQGPSGILARVREQLYYSVIALVIAAAIAIPLGLLIGHTGRGVVLVAGVANALRAIPTFGLLILLVVLISPHINSRGELPYLVPTEIVLILLAVPPMLTNTYAGVQNVDPTVRDAARGMGMTGSQVVRKVELPNALPLILSGTRSAALQVIATATVAAYVTLGGLGRYLVDGLSTLNDPHEGYPAMASGALLVALLAVIVDLLFAGAQRLLVSRGVSGRFRRARRSDRARTQPGSMAGALSEVEVVKA